MSIINGYYDNFSNYGGPKGNLGDYQHAARLYVDNNMRLAPKFKHLFHVVFNVNAQAKERSPLLNGVDQLEINILAKGADLPRYTVQTATLNQYNRKKIVQTGIQYVPLNLEFHDDNAGITSLFWEAYFRYYYSDSNYTTKDSAGFPSQTVDAYSKIAGGLNNAYGNSETQIYRFGLDRPNKQQNFFNSIQIFQMHPQDKKSTFTSFTLINPYIETYTHDDVSQENTEFSINRMSIQYESVQYNRGYTTVGSAPTGFAEVHYDNTPSPLQIPDPSGLVRTQTLIAGAQNSVPELKRGNYKKDITENQKRFYQNTKELTYEPARSGNFSLNETLNSTTLGNISFPKADSSPTTVEASPKRF